MPAIKMYGADWCGDCRRAKRLLDSRGVAYDWIDVENNPSKADEAQRIGGRRNIPVIVLPDQTVLVEPTDPELDEALNRLPA